MPCVRHFRSPGRYALILIAALCILVPSISRAAKPRKNVLFLNSYENGYSWSDTIVRGVKEQFSQSPYNVDLQVEYMDSKRHTSETMQSMLLGMFKYKFHNVHFDAIISSDNFAYDFLQNNARTAFPGVPVIFCGVNDLTEKGIQQRDLFSGVIENIDATDTIRLALRLRPETKKIVVIGNNDITSVAIRNQVNSALSYFKDRVGIAFWIHSSLDQLLARVVKLPKDTIIYFIPFYKDAHGQFYSAEEVLESIAAVSLAPIFSNWHFLLDHGIVGGRLLDGIQTGKMAAQKAMEIFEGKQPADIPVTTNFLGQYNFDYRQLQKFSIDQDSLPPASIIINEPYRFYALHQQIFWLIILSLVVLSGFSVLLILNILKRKRVEENLRQAEEKYHSIFENSALGIFRTSPEGRYLDVNPAMALMLGYDSPQTLIENVHNIPQELYVEPEKWSILTTSDASTEENINFENQYKRRDGSIISTNLHMRIFRDSEKNIKYFEGFAEDITKSEQARKALKASQQMLKLVLDNIPQLVSWKDRNFSYMGANTSFCSFFEIKDEGLILGKTDFDLMPNNKDALQAYDHDRKVISSNQPEYHIEQTITMTSGKQVRLETTTVPLYDDNGQVVGVLSTSEDVTQRVNLERQLLQSQKMEAIGTLAGGIAHDFNNILTSIINSTELALMDIEKGTMTHQDMTRVLTASQRGSRLVKQILTFSRPSQEGFVSTNVSEVVKEAASLIKASLPGNIRVGEYIVDEKVLCQADPTQIHQIVMNLCTNSFQAMRPQGGELCILLSTEILAGTRAKVMEVAPGYYAKLVITDNGPGMTPEIMGKIFDPFFTTKGKTEGTGLGLAVVHGIVKGHNGGIEVWSQPGKGTSFSIFLPLDDQPVADMDAEIDRIVKTGSGRIIFVEDDRDQLQTIPRVLALLGYRVTPVKSARNALRIIKQQTDCDLIITDYDMPEMNGLELAMEVEQIAPHLPIIMVSGRIMAAEMARLAGNVQEVILKPYNKTTLSAAISRVLRTDTQETVQPPNQTGAP
ncbi:MAG: PAS domain S-box protein [Desulfoplanes sp.]